MTALRAELLPGDPAKPFWVYADLDIVFGVGRSQRRIRDWEARGFPAPLPWSHRERRWNPHAVLRWKEREEARMPGNAALAPHLQLISERSA
jgi:hypothetical protein